MPYLCPHHRPCINVSEREAALNYHLPGLRRLYIEGVFDVLVGCGAGSVIMTTLMSDRLGCPMGLVRKRGEPVGHSYAEALLPFPDDEHAHRWLFVDDLLASGATFSWVLDRMGATVPAWTCAGLFLYFDSRAGGTTIYPPGSVKPYPVLSNGLAPLAMPF